MTFKTQKHKFVSFFLLFFLQKKAVLRDTLSRLKPSPQLLKMGAGLLYFIAFLQCIYYLTMKFGEAIDFRIDSFAILIIAILLFHLLNKMLEKHANSQWIRY